MEGTAPPSAVAPDFTATHRDEALRADCFVWLLAKGAPVALHEGPAKRDRAAEGDAATAVMD